MISALSKWSEKCSSTLGDLEAQIRNIRVAAATREKEKRAAEKRTQTLMSESRESEKTTELSGREGLPRRGLNKRSMVDRANIASDETMDVDEPPAAEEHKKRSSKRKM
jgi:COP9 signalosome complex subunit 7